MTCKTLTAAVAALALGLCAAPASAACGPGKMAGSWTFTAGVFTCVVTIDAAGKFPTARCEGATLPSNSAALTAKTPLGDVTLGALAISSAGKLSGTVTTTSICRIEGRLVFTDGDGLKTVLTLNGRTDDQTNMFAGTAVNRKVGSEALLSLGGYRN